MKNLLQKALFLLRGQSAARHVIVHAHMFKNAGTTLDWSLQRSFGEQHLDHRDDDRMREGANYLTEFLQAQPELEALSSHWITFPLPTERKLQLHLLMMFRDPIERIRSVYAFERRQEPAETPGSKKAKQLSFKDYVKWQLEPMPGPVVKNFHTRYCSGEYLGEELALLNEKARETVSNAPLLGIVERYDESMVLLEHSLKRQFPTLDLAYRVQNATRDLQQDPAVSRLQVLDELGDIADAVMAANRYDIELYADVCKQFEQAYANIPNAETKLHELRRRCALLS